MTNVEIIINLEKKIKEYNSLWDSILNRLDKGEIKKDSPDWQKPDKLEQEIKEIACSIKCS